MNLQTLFPAIEWDRVEEYYIELTGDMTTTVATSNIYQIEDCRDIEDNLRVHFLNSLGAIDAVNLKIISRIHETKSEGYELSEKTTFDRSAHQLSRNTVTANDTFTGYKVIEENEVGYYEELVDSPLAWIEFGIEYLAIVILDTSFVKFKEEDRYMYELIVEFKYSKEKKIIRN